MKLGLEYISRLLEELGDPHERFPSVLVAGTNGKGSVTSFLSSILRSAGLRVGSFYSPHLIRINERIRVDGLEIPTADLDRLIGTIRRFHQVAPFTFFEGLVAVSALYFLERKVDIAVFEVGLGGRLDATRLVNAVLTVITGISLDHVEHLGKTREAILNEKLQIVRGSVPLVANLPTAGLTGRAKRFCDGRGVPFFDVRKETRPSLRSHDVDRMVFDLETPRRSYRDLATTMIGSHQLRNIATSVRSVEVLMDNVFRKADDAFGKLGRKLKRVDVVETVRSGIGSARLAGRFHVLKGSPRFILDVSHNEDGLLASLETLRKISKPSRSIIVFGILDNKDPGRFPARALKSAREILLVPLKTSRSAKTEKIHGLFKNASKGLKGAAGVSTFKGCAEAMRYIGRNTSEGDTILILGSHHMVEDAVRYL